jgi:U-box domain
MNDPLMNMYGQSYERDAIIDHITIQQKPYCPVTQQSMSVKDLVPNCKLRNEIVLYRGTMTTNSTTATAVDEDTIREVEVYRACRAVLWYNPTEFTTSLQAQRKKIRVPFLQRRFGHC